MSWKFFCDECKKESPELVVIFIDGANPPLKHELCKSCASKDLSAIFHQMLIKMDGHHSVSFYSKAAVHG